MSNQSIMEINGFQVRHDEPPSEDLQALQGEMLQRSSYPPVIRPSGSLVCFSNLSNPMGVALF